MARPLRVEFPGAVHLVTARALPRRKLYRDPDDLRQIVGWLPGLVQAYGIVLHAFCVLPGHYHLLVETPGANLSRAVHRFNARLTGLARSGRGRPGPVLRGRFRSLVIDPDEWLVPLSVHVHLNPVRKRLAPDPWAHPGSSARAFRPEPDPVPGVDPARVLGLAGGPAAYAALLERALADPPPAPWPRVWRGVVLGDGGLRARVLELLEGRDLREVPGFGQAGDDPGRLDEIVERVAEYTGLDPGQIVRGKYQRVLARKVAIYLARRHTALTLRQIGERFGLDYTSVHMVVRRLESLRRADPAVDELVTELEAAIAPGPAPKARSPGKGRKGGPRGRKKKPGPAARKSPQLSLF